MASGKREVLGYIRLVVLLNFSETPVGQSCRRVILHGEVSCLLEEDNRN